MRFTLRARAAAQCARCRAEIRRGEPCFERAVPYAYEPQLLHPACALDVDTVAFTAAFSECSDRMPDWAALNALVTTRNAAIDQRRSAQWLSYSIPDMPGLRSISEPIHAFEDDRHWVSPARDAQGRPRVRVLRAGSAFSREHTSRERIDALTHARSWASPKREYVFEQREGARALECDDDPAQPIVATLYAPIATSDSLIEGVEHLQLWRALRFGVSMLWLIGADSGRTRDEHTLRSRELLVSNGLDGDRCPVLYAPEITEAALDHLVLALDEHVDGSELRVREAPLRAIARTVRDDVCAQSAERAEPRAWSFRLDKLSATKDTVIDRLLSEAALAGAVSSVTFHGAGAAVRRLRDGSPTTFALVWRGNQDRGSPRGLCLDPAADHSPTHVVGTRIDRAHRERKNVRDQRRSALESLRSCRGGMSYPPNSDR